MQLTDNTTSLESIHFMKRLFIVSRRSVATFFSLAFVSGCAAPIKPDDLQTPRELTCTYMKEPLSFTGHYGLLDVPWTTRLERGPYWSEKVDDKGTYYRAPPGGVSITTTNGAGIPGQAATADGGFYVPNGANEPVTIYKYFSTAAAPVEVPPNGADCSTVGYIKDPSTSKVSLVSFGTSGAIGGAAAGVVGRSIAQGGAISYGQAAGAGAAGGLIGGLIIASIINADVGKIVPGLPIQDAEFMAKLRTLAASKVPALEVQLPASTADAQSATTK